MFLSDFSIKRPVATVVIIIALMCLGLMALQQLRVNQIPDVEQPLLVVTIPYPGASPDTVEREVINRIEKAFQSISGVDEVRSTASEGQARLVVIFKFSKNMIEAADEIRNAIGTVRYKLPTEMLYSRSFSACSSTDSSRCSAPLTSTVATPGRPRKRSASWSSA